jgi:hypothetical protein
MISRTLQRGLANLVIAWEKATPRHDAPVLK